MLVVFLFKVYMRSAIFRVLFCIYTFLFKALMKTGVFCFTFKVLVRTGVSEFSPLFLFFIHW